MVTKMVEYIRSFNFLFGMLVPLGVIGAVSASTLTTPEKALEIIRSQDHHFDKPHVVKVAVNG